MIFQADRAEVDHLKRLGEYKAKLAGTAENLERKKLWYKLDEGRPERPMVLIYPEGVIDDPYTKQFELQCKDPFLRTVELELRTEIYHCEILKDDRVIEPFIPLKWDVSASGCGVEILRHSVAEGVRGSISWEPPLKDLEGDLNQLRSRTFSVDREGTLAKKSLLESIFQGILPVRLHGRYGTGARLTARAIELAGIENFMLFMYDNPDGLHRLMAFLRDDHLNWLEWLEKENLLCLNNGNDTIGSGSIGYSRFLPQEKDLPDGITRLKDQWGFADAQETSCISPDMFEEFILPYIVGIVKKFGRVYYGCCEPLQKTIASILQKLPNIRRVSVSPWADEEEMAAKLGSGIVYSRKPNPSMLSTDVFSEEQIRQDIRKTLSIADGHPLEFIMKDLHTLKNMPERAPRWVEIVKEEICARD